jgi:predicted nucleotidyltransferase
VSGLADFSWYRGNLTWLPGRTIFLAKHGSHAYGTNITTSDLDIKGVAIPRRWGKLRFYEHTETSRRVP